MADQQFLASFGVDIDESGVNRLQTILTENRTLADSMAASFDAASESVKAFREQVVTDLPTMFSGSGYGRVTENLFGEYAGLKIGLNMTEPKKEIASFTESAKKPIPLSANASAIVSAARTALENVRSLFSETFTLNVRANTDHQLSYQGSRPFSTEKEPLALSPGVTNPPTPSAGMSNNDSAFLRMSSGGRFSKPTDVQVAEDGDAEYIIPVKKENQALPLLRQLMEELSPEARQSLTPLSVLPREAEESPGGNTSSGNAAKAEADRQLSAQPAPVPDPVILNDREEFLPLPPVRETLSEETSPVVSVQVPAPELSIPAPVPVPAVEKEPPPAPTVAIPDLHQIVEEMDRPQVPAPVMEKELSTASTAVIPDLHQIAEEMDCSPVPAPAPAAEKEPVAASTAAIPDLHQIAEEVERQPVPAPAPAAEKEPAAAPTAAIPDLHQIVEEVERPPVQVPAPAAEKEPAAAPSAAIPDLHQIVEEMERPPVSVPAPTAEKEPAPTVAVPDLRQILAEEDRPLASVQTVPETKKEQAELSSSVQAPLPMTEKEQEELPSLAPIPFPAAEKEQTEFTLPIPVLKPAAEKEPTSAPVAPIPNFRQVLAEADHPLAPAPAVDKESFPSAADSPKQNLSDLVSQLSSVLRPSGGSVTNTSNNLSAPVTINVNANGSDANRIGQSIYDTAERYLLRTLKGAYS